MHKINSVADGYTYGQTAQRLGAAAMTKRVSAAIQAITPAIKAAGCNANRRWASGDSSLTASYPPSNTRRVVREESGRHPINKDPTEQAAAADV